jgi:hypothetical protein
VNRAADVPDDFRPTDRFGEESSDFSVVHPRLQNVRPHRPDDPRELKRAEDVGDACSMPVHLKRSNRDSQAAQDLNLTSAIKHRDHSMLHLRAS